MTKQWNEKYIGVVKQCKTITGATFKVKWSYINIFDNEENMNVTLEHKNCIKYLGILIDENLSWKIISIPLQHK